MEKKNRFIFLFQVQKEVPFGKSVYLCGSLPNIGSWQIMQAQKLEWSEDNVWFKKIYFESTQDKTNLEYKYFIADSKDLNTKREIHWEVGPNRTVKIHKENRFLKIVDDIWDHFKLIFHFIADPEVYQMYITGETSCKHFHIARPAKMSLRIMASNNIPSLNDTVVKVWEKEFTIPSVTESIKYRFGTRSKSKSEIVWEREPNRFCSFKDLRTHKISQFDHYNDALGLKQKQTIFLKFQNSSYRILDAVFVNDLVYSRISDKISLGPYPYFEEINTLNSKGFKAVLNLQTNEDMDRLGYSKQRYLEVCSLAGVNYEETPIQHFQNSAVQAQKCLQAVLKLEEMVDKYKQVYVFCSEGVTRSPLIVMLYLHLIQKYDILRSVKMVKKKRIRCNATKELLEMIISQLNVQNEVEMNPDQKTTIQAEKDFKKKYSHKFEAFQQ